MASYSDLRRYPSTVHVFAHLRASICSLIQAIPDTSRLVTMEILWPNEKPWKAEKGSSHHFHMCFSFVERSAEHAGMPDPNNKSGCASPGSKHEVPKTWFHNVSECFMYPQVFSLSVFEFCGEIGVEELDV